MTPSNNSKLERNQRNLDPHRSARMAMYLYSSRYAAQGGGSMDFWDKLTEGEKKNCRECVQLLISSRPE